jgi:hypothetical protein
VKAQTLGFADMLANICRSPAGQVEIMQMQREGFARVRP